MDESMGRPMSEIKAYLRSKTCTSFSRKETDNPWNYGGYWAVTDGHCMWMVRDGNKENTYPGKPNESFSKWFGPVEWTGKINISELEEVVKKAESIKSYPMMQCPECKGGRTIHCDCCDYENDCRKCDGRGEIKRDGNEMFFQVVEGQHVSIGGKIFDASRINDFVSSCNFLGISNMKASFIGSAVVFEQGIYRYLQMNQMDFGKPVLGHIDLNQVNKTH